MKISSKQYRAERLAAVETSRKLATANSAKAVRDTGLITGAHLIPAEFLYEASVTETRQGTAVTVTISDPRVIEVVKEQMAKQARLDSTVNFFADIAGLHSPIRVNPLSVFSAEDLMSSGKR